MAHLQFKNFKKIKGKKEKKRKKAISASEEQARYQSIYCTYKAACAQARRHHLLRIWYSFLSSQTLIRLSLSPQDRSLLPTGTVSERVHLLKLPLVLALRRSRKMCSLRCGLFLPLALTALAPAN